MKNASGWNAGVVILAICSVLVVSASAQNLQTLVSFEGPNGSNPEYGNLVQDSSGNIYGTTSSGGAYQKVNGPSAGTVFKIAPDGTLTTLYSFCAAEECPDGNAPAGGLTLGNDGFFYGTTSQGGGGYGTIFKIDSSGNLTTLYSFNPPIDGAAPTAAPILATDGNLYGSTGKNNESDVDGSLYRLTPQGVYTTLVDLDPLYPYPTGTLVQATDGNLYGETSNVIFRLALDGTFTVINNSGGSGGLIQATDGNLYGTTAGANLVNPCQTNCGTVFKVTLDGSLTTLYSFDFAHGVDPQAGVIQGTDGNFYGTTLAGGNPACNPQAVGCGTVFQLTPQGVATVLATFDGNNGMQARGGLLQASSGLFYGTTFQGGDLSCDSGLGCGTVFSLTSSGPAPGASVSPSSLTYPDQGLNVTSAAQNVTLKNAGGVSLGIAQISIVGTDMNDFAQSNNCGLGINAGASCTISVTFTPTALGSRTATLSISDAVGDQSVALSGTGIQTIGLGIAPGGSNSATVTAGGTAMYTLSIGGAGLSGTATLFCTGAPAGATCTVPSSENVSAATASQFTVSVTTMAPGNAALRRRGSSLAWFWATLLIGIVWLPLARQPRRFARRTAAILSLLLVTFLTSCGGGNGGGGSGSGGTPAGTYTLTVTATMNGPSQSQTLKLTVN